MIIAIILCLIIIVLEILILTSNKKSSSNPPPKTTLSINSIMSQPNSCELCYRMNDEMKAKCESAERSNFDKCDMNRQITYQNCLNQCN